MISKLIGATPAKRDCEMDLGAGLADFAVHALWLQAGAVIALAVALAGAAARARRQAEARAGADRR